MELQAVVPAKSPNDQRQYQAIQLPNKLKILLVHDAKAQKGACSISVSVGSLMDRERSLGIAHFLEHMLFMGSKKYPKHNQYSEFISLNSGSDNAYTGEDQTNYQFEIATGKFPEAVERICDFFVEALLTSDCISKERQAVHEQCMLRVNEDNSRKWQILKHFASGPYHNHSIGNNNTLSHDKVEEDLRDFYQKQYSANRITACLLSAMSIEEMKEKLLPFFKQIQNKQLQKIEYQLHFQKKNIGKWVQMQSIKDQVLMQFFWQIDSCKPYYKSHPNHYITHVIGHQGKNSLMAMLKTRDWATQITSYSHDLPRQTIIGLELHLTELGQQNHEKVYNFVVDYITSLKPSKYIYEELAETNAIAFKFKEKSGNFDYVTLLSSTMQEKPLSEVLNWKYEYAEYNQQIIAKFLSQLVPENVIVVYSCSDELTDPITEKHLGGKFIVKDLPKRNPIQNKFDDLMKNPFFPLKTDLVESKINTPIKDGNIWLVQGDFGVCKGGVQLKVCKAESEIFLQFYGNYLDLLLKELTYEAECLKLSVQFQADEQFTIHIFGFSHAVQKLLQQIGSMIGKVHKGPLASKLFKLAHQNLEEQYDNFYESEVDEVVGQLVEISLKSNSTDIEERQKQLKSYKYKKICQRIDDFWKNAKLQWIVAGNFEKDIVHDIIKKFEKSVGSDFSAEKMSIQCIKLQKDKPITNVTYLQSEDISTSAVIKYKQIGQYSELKFYTLSLLKNYIQTPYFDKLRTEMQLAYYLAAYQRNVRGILSLWFLLISSNANPWDVSNHISTFVDNFIAKIDEDLTEEKFETLKQSLVSKTLEPFHSLQKYFEFVSKQINRGTFCFDRKTNGQKLNQYLSQIKRQDVVNMLKQCLHFGMEVWVVAQAHRQEVLDKGKIPNEISFADIKKNHEYYKDKTIQG